MRRPHAAFSCASAALSGLVAERVAAQTIRAMPATTEPALANWALDKPQSTLGLRRINSTRKRAIPLSSRYWPTIAPELFCLPNLHPTDEDLSAGTPSLHQSHAPMST